MICINGKLCLMASRTSSGASTVSTIKSRISALTNSGCLRSLSGRISFVGRLLGSRKIGQCSLLFVGQSLGIRLRLIGHLGLRSLLGLGSLKRSDCLGRVGLGGFCGRVQSLGLLQCLHFCGFGSLNGLSRLGRLCGFGESCGLRSLCSLRNLCGLGLFSCYNRLSLLGSLNSLSRKGRFRLLGSLCCSGVLCVLCCLGLVSGLLGDGSSTSVTDSVSPRSSSSSRAVSATTSTSVSASKPTLFLLVRGSKCGIEIVCVYNTNGPFGWSSNVFVIFIVFSLTRCCSSKLDEFSVESSAWAISLACKTAIHPVLKIGRMLLLI